MSKRIEVDDEVAAWVETYIDRDRGYPDAAAVVRDAMLRLSCTQDYDADKVEAVFDYGIHLDYAVSRLDSVVVGTEAAISREISRLRQLRLGERVSQMEEVTWTTKSHMGVLAAGMADLLKRRRPWYVRLWRAWRGEND